MITRDEIVPSLAMLAMLCLGLSSSSLLSLPLVLGPFPWWIDDRPANSDVLALHIFPVVAGLASVLIFVSLVGAVESHRSWGFMREKICLNIVEKGCQMPRR